MTSQSLNIGLYPYGPPFVQKAPITDPGLSKPLPATSFQRARTRAHIQQIKLMVLAMLFYRRADIVNISIYGHDAGMYLMGTSSQPDNVAELMEFLDARIVNLGTV